MEDAISSSISSVTNSPNRKLVPCSCVQKMAGVDDVLRSFRKAQDLLRLGKNDDAFESFTEFIERESFLLELGHHKELSQAYNERGYIRYLRVDFGKAVDDYTKSISLDEDFPVPYYNRGQIHYRLGRYHLAREDLQKAVTLSPEFSDAVLNLSQIERDLDNGYRFNTKDPHHNGSDLVQPSCKE